MAEMLVQSHAGEINLLPALPRSWPEGAIKGLRARGAIEVDLSWTAGKARLAVLRADVSGEHKLRPPRGQRVFMVTENGKRLPVTASQDGAINLRVRARKLYRITFEAV